MDSNRLNDIFHKFSHIFSTKRTRFTLYMVAVLWVAVATQVIVNRMFQEEAQITEAFIKSETHEMQSGLEVLAEYNTKLLNDSDKKNLIYKIAGAIGLIVDDDITIWEEDARSEYFYFKQAKKATTEIKVVSLQQQENEDEAAVLKHYIIVRLNILQGIKSIDKYKKILEEVMTDLGVTGEQITMKYEGNREGDLTSMQKHEIAELLVGELQGKIALEYDEGDLYTIYAYTGMLNDYVTSMGNKINVQIAITYNELTNKTRISLATPINNDSW